MTHHKDFKTKMNLVYRVNKKAGEARKAFLDDYWGGFLDRFLIHQDKQYIARLEKLTEDNQHAS